VKDGRIEEVAAGLSPRSDEQVLDCGGCVVLPGFVDPHTHLVFGGWRADEFEQRLAGRTYRQILDSGGGILSTVKATRAASEDELYELALERLREMVAWGTTTVEVKSGYGLETETELKMLRVAKRLGESGLATVVSTFLGAHSVPKETSKPDYMRLLTGTMIPAVAEQRIARFCDVFCEKFVFNAMESTRILEAGQKHGLAPTVHADELESSCGAEVAGRLGAASASHLLRPSSAGLRLMADHGVVAVLLPGTCLMLREEHRPPVAAMRDMRIAMAVATDFNPGSCTLLAQPLALQLACIHYGLTIEEALRAATVNAAKALMLDREVGTLEPGRAADIVVTDVPEYRHLAYRLGHNPVRRVLKAGRATHPAARA
jgi:imidazolonepropionase